LNGFKTELSGSDLHGLLCLGDSNLVSVFLKNLDAVRSVLVAFRLGVHLKVFRLEITLVLNFALLDDDHIDV